MQRKLALICLAVICCKRAPAPASVGAEGQSQSVQTTLALKDVRPEALVRALYPNWNERTKLTGENSGGEAKSADLLASQSRTVQGREQLVVLIDTWVGERCDLELCDPQRTDIAVFEIRGGTLQVVATARAATQHGGKMSTQLDLAPYHMDASTTLLGVRERWHSHGSERVLLILYRIEGDTLRQVFERVMVDSEDELQTGPGCYATLAVETANTGPAIFKVTEECWEGEGPDTGEQFGVRSSMERWVWDGQQYTILSSTPVGVAGQPTSVPGREGLVGPSFDCSRAATHVERSICSSNELQRLDRELADAYRLALLRANNSPTLRQRQRSWLQQRDGCTTNECLILMYTERIAELRIN